ncbi:hypothetical protein AB0C29_39840, partial [Actinoplanes sp. NPDC048791]
AFRVVELLLAGDTGPVSVSVDLSGDPLRISMRPMPADEGGEIAAGLRARLAAVGGSMATAADGLPEIHLPAPTTAHPGEGRPVSGPTPLPVTGDSTGNSPAPAQPEREAAQATGATGAEARTNPMRASDPLSASNPAGEGQGPAGTIPADDGPGTPAGDDKEVASSPSG